MDIKQVASMGGKAILKARGKEYFSRLGKRLAKKRKELKKLYEQQNKISLSDNDGQRDSNKNGR